MRSVRSLILVSALHTAAGCANPDGVGRTELTPTAECQDSSAAQFVSRGVSVIPHLAHYAMIGRSRSDVDVVQSKVEIVRSRLDRTLRPRRPLHNATPVATECHSGKPNSPLQRIPQCFGPSADVVRLEADLQVQLDCDSGLVALAFAEPWFSDDEDWVRGRYDVWLLYEISAGELINGCIPAFRIEPDLQARFATKQVYTSCTPLYTPKPDAGGAVPWIDPREVALERVPCP